ncbi:uncharacterized protein [Triticum aestivum]|uniref:uncharacterized protein isoform X2 n=1 Tax=Triticum aestivum TaxID=4565 RepID=UPI001D010269|nr:uncharacterized protein LOC123182444 isoform X2 [Triticum aestivum]
MREPSDGASSAPARAFELRTEEWRPVVKVAEYIPKVPGEPKRTLWRLNSSNIRKYQGIKPPKIGLLNSGVDSSLAPSRILFKLLRQGSGRRLSRLRNTCPRFQVRQNEHYGEQIVQMCTNIMGFRGQELLVSRYIRLKGSSGKANQNSTSKSFQKMRCDPALVGIFMSR